MFLSLTYFNDYNSLVTCSIQARFSILLLNKSLTCTEKIYLHPRLNIKISGQLIIYDCRAYLFKEKIYQTSIQFHRRNILTDNQITKMKSSEKTCQYILENTSYLNNNSLIQTNEVLTTINLFSFHNPWKQYIQTLGTCRTKLIPYSELFFTDDVMSIRNVIIETGQTIHIRCKRF